MPWRLVIILLFILSVTSNIVQKSKEPYIAEDIYNIFVDYGVSAHYLIGREGEIYLLVSESRVAYHAGKGILNHFPKYKDQSIKRNRQHIVGHDEYSPDRKTDPGLLFNWTRIVFSIKRLIEKTKCLNQKIQALDKENKYLCHNMKPGVNMQHFTSNASR